MRKMKKLVPILLCIILALSFSLGATACGGDGGADAGGGGHMVLGVTKAMDTLNPLVSELGISFEIFSLIYDTLIRFDEDMEAVPCLAESWEVTDDQLTWTFHLAEANWHDGEPFTSNDVKWTYDLMINGDEDLYLGYMYADYLGGIESIECPDDRTLVIKTEEPKANMLQSQVPILPEHLFSDKSDEELAEWDNPECIGTGPFKFMKKNETSVFLERNDDYFMDPPKLENLTFVLYKSADSMAQALKTGEIDATVDINPDQKPALVDNKDLQIISGDARGFTQIAVNVLEDGNGNPLLRDQAIRYAIEYATDKQKAKEMFYDDAGETGTSFMSPTDKFHYAPPADILRDYDLEKAKAVLDEAGYTKTDANGIRESADGDKLSFDLICIADNTQEVKFGQLIKSGCEEVGIEINLETMDSGALIDAAGAYDYDMFIWGWGTDVDPTIILGILTEDAIETGFNEPGWVNPEYDALVAKQATLMDEEERIKMVQDAQAMVYEDAPYIILIYDNFTQGYRSDKWEGFKQIPDDGTYFYNMTAINYMNVVAK